MADSVPYLALKHAHAAIALLSGALFVLRFFLFRCLPHWRQRLLLKVVPHLVDTTLLILAIGLCITIAQYPGTHAWLTAKVIGLLGYIGFGVIAMRRNQLRAFGLALCCYAYIVGVAFTHSAWSWASG